jgi:dihydroneopterin aldolase
MPGMFTIELKQLRFFAHHGLYQEERKTGNEFEVNISMQIKANPQKVHTIDDTADYGVVFDITKKVMQKTEDLLETVTMNIADEIHNRFITLSSIRVTIIKLHAPVAGLSGQVGVTFEKEF